MIAILQPFIPHYREDFFTGLGSHESCDVFVYDKKEADKSNFRQSGIATKKIASFERKGILVYNPFSLLKQEYKVLVLMLNFAHLSTWILLLTRIFHRKKIILWGHGISVKRYTAEEQRPSRLLRWMIGLSDGVWFYTAKEKEIWQKIHPQIPSVSLNNTISEVDRIVSRVPGDKQILRGKYRIREEVIFIFSARFNTADRRIDLLEESMKKLSSKKFGFIIIGDGKLKPDFGRYKNVYDFGELYDRQTKNELFDAADIYFQPGWLGLSIVEAMAYGKPIISFERSTALKQCVEYAYVQNGFNGLIFSDTEAFLTAVQRLSFQELTILGENGKRFAATYLSMDNMVNSGLSLIKKIRGEKS
ncbi:glycosyltransferase [Terrimonas sp. NA20]|uniref:Glycosyltransferase n=1 Tax=Terrimonas ginsenosidimutans TaxID=2908004 RepID=A0ABS9L0J5_9BACT|nr:glycosyltransferase [Terrimonas ginsenosidimutans]MCG2618080.1 glycosyltransferase [Terrimonas ginsenosidimutans]